MEQLTKNCCAGFNFFIFKKGSIAQTAGENDDKNGYQFETMQLRYRKRVDYAESQLSTNVVPEQNSAIKPTLKRKQVQENEIDAAKRVKQSTNTRRRCFDV